MATTAPARAVPAHVPAELVTDVDIYDIPGGDIDPQAAWRSFRTKGPLSWSTKNGGHWVATEGAAVFQFFRDAKNFSSKVIAIPDPGPDDRQLPIQADAPDHTEYRKNIMPLFTAEAIDSLTKDVRDLAVTLIEEMKPKGKCDFVMDFAFQFPLTIFLRMMGLPLEDRMPLRRLVERFTDTPDIEQRMLAHKELHEYVDAAVADRIANPRKDAITRITRMTINGRPYTSEEMRSTVVLMLHAGLDTVAGMVSFMALDLARNPEHAATVRARLHDETAMHQVVQEYLRRFPIANMTRQLTCDFTYEGVTMKKGDLIILPPTFFNMDESRMEKPDEIDLDRASTRHISFGSGPHTCAGALLAREELRIFLEEWLTRMPQVRLDPNHPPRVHAMPLNAVNELPLVWDV
jgi:cytochrome P450